MRVTGNLPPYSPDFNPSEQVFAKDKGSLRRLRPRSWQDINAEIAARIPTIAAHDAHAFFTTAGFPVH